MDTTKTSETLKIHTIETAPKYSYIRIFVTLFLDILPRI